MQRIETTILSGSPQQRSSFVPAYVELQDRQGLGPVDDAQVKDVLRTHAPLRGRKLRPSHLPNFVRKIVSTCFLATRTGNRSVDPIAHILHKAWPMRCSVRNFSDIVSMYILNNDEVYYFVLLILHASMIGVYGTALQASQELEILMYRYYVHKPISREHLSQWVQQDNHMLLFIAIKEYMVYAIQTTPGIARVLHEVYNWGAFVVDVNRQGDAVRTALHANVATPSAMFQAALGMVSTTRCFKCPPPALNYGTVGEQLIAAIRQVYQPSEDVYMYPLRTLLYYNLEPLVQANVPFATIARAFGLRDSLVTTLSHAVESRASSASMRELRKITLQSSFESILLHEFMQAWTMCFRIHTCPLPQHIVQQQLECRAAPVKHNVYACACCRQLREFIVDESTHGGNAWARGHQKVILDDETGDVFCGRRIEKAGVIPRTVPRGTSATLSRSFWKSQQTHMCGYSPLLKFNLFGKMLYFFGKAYMFCPSCMCVMQVRPQQFHQSTIRCTHCTYQGQADIGATCFHCHQRQDTSMLALALHSTIVHVCKKCTRPWMRMDDITSKMHIDTAHQSIDERWATNRVMAHCACI